MKKLVLLFCIIFIMMTGITVSAIGGDGSPENPFQITTQEGLELINDFPECDFILMNDLELQGVFVPLCLYSDAFSGTLNGNGKTISNLTITSNYSKIGLFAENNGTIKNLTVQTSETGINYNYNTIYSDASTGILAAINTGNIINCNVYGNIKYVSSNYTRSSSNIARIGGCVGANRGVLDSCYANININAESYTTSTATSLTSGTRTYYGYNFYIGGLVGISTTNVSTSIAKGDINVTKSYQAYIGGIAGSLNTCALSNSYFIGNLSGKSSQSAYIAGIAGNFYQSTIENCYAVATKGGLVSFAYSGSEDKVINSYFDKTVSGLSSTNYGEPKSTLAMKMKATYKNWDFEKIWGLSKGMNDGYPYLLLEKNNLKPEITYNPETQYATIITKEAISCIVVFANYENNRFVDMEIKTIDLVVGQNDISTTSNLEQGDKIMIFDTLDKLTPLFETYNI